MRRTPPVCVALVPVTVGADGTAVVEPSAGAAAGFVGAQAAAMSNTASTGSALVQAKGKRTELGIGGILKPERRAYQANLAAQLATFRVDFCDTSARDGRRGVSAVR
jgi:hypothetical protein